MSDTDPRLADGAVAEPHAFVVGGLGLTLMGLVARLAADGQLEALLALEHVSFVQPRATGTRGSPAFELTFEADEETWARLSPHVPDIERILEQTSAVAWTVHRRPPLAVPGVGRRRAVEVTRAAIASALASAGATDAALLAEWASGFHIRPRPGDGQQIVTVGDEEQDTNEEFHRLPDAIFRHLHFRTANVSSHGFNALARRLAPTPRPEVERRPAVAVIKSGGGTMAADIDSHLAVFDVSARTIRMNSPDAAESAATVLRQLDTSSPRPDAVLIVRGGGDPADLKRLGVDVVQREVEQLRNHGTYVVAAIGHGNEHVDLHADEHARTPTSGAQIIRRVLFEQPEAYRQALADHVVRVEALSYQRGEDVMHPARMLLERLATIAEDTADVVARHRQPTPPEDPFSS